MLIRFGRRAPHLPARLTTSLLSTKNTQTHWGLSKQLPESAQGTYRAGHTSSRLFCTNTSARAAQEKDPDRDGGKEIGPKDEKELQVHQTEHAVISTFDLFSIGGA